MTDLPQPGGKFAEALAAFQAEAPTVAKNKTANAGSYSYAYADLADIAHVAYPILAKHGLAFTSAPHGDELVGKLIHVSGEGDWGSLQISGRDMQAIGSSITYARRYLFGCLTGIVTDADDDGAAASKPKAKPAARKPQQQEEPAPYMGADRISEKQTRMLAIVLKEAGLTDRDECLKHVSGVIGREITSRTELTKSEASKVIDGLSKKPQTTREQIAYANNDPWAEKQ